MEVRCQIASMPEREDALRRCVRRMLPQVDSMFIALNNYSEPPSFVNHPKITYRLLDNIFGDAAKFMGLKHYNGYVVVIDDDLSPKDSTYVEYMVSKVKEHKGVVSLLGKVYEDRPVTSFRKGYTLLLRCLGTVSGDVHVDVVGSGACAFHTDHIRPTLKDFPVPNMADIWLSKLATEKGVPLVAVEHDRNTLFHIISERTIWRDSEDMDEYQTQVLNSFLK